MNDTKSRIDPGYKPNNILDINKEYFDFIHILTTYQKYVKPTDVVVEIGASTKSRTCWISRYCKKLIAVEYSSDRLFGDFDNVTNIHCDWQILSSCLTNDTIDIVISSQCLEHISDDLAAINETYKILKKGGVAIINTPNRKRLIRTIIELFTGPRKFPYWEHFREYTRLEIVELINRSNFKGHKIEGICIGIKPKKYLSIKKCPERLESLCTHWEITLFK